MTLKSKTLLTFFVLVVFLLSFNLSSFAAMNNTYSFKDVNFVATKKLLSGEIKNVTSSVSRQYLESVSLFGGKGATTFKYTDGNVCSTCSLITGLTELELYTNTQYSYDFYVMGTGTTGNNISLTVQILYVNSSTNLPEVETTLIQFDDLKPNTVCQVKGNLVTPQLTGSYYYQLYFGISENGNVGSSITFYASDIDMNVISELNGYHIDTPSIDDLNNSISNLDSVEAELPNLDNIDFDNILAFDNSDFLNSFAFIRAKFEQFMSISTLNSVLVFCMAIGFITYVIGRKVG